VDNCCQLRQTPNYTTGVVLRFVNASNVTSISCLQVGLTAALRYISTVSARHLLMLAYSVRSTDLGERCHMDVDADGLLPQQTRTVNIS